MKIVLCAIDAKFIHTNAALRMIRAACPFPCRLLEFTIKSAPSEIVDAIASERPDLVGFSVYLWNVDIVKTVAAALRARCRTTIVAGGPEITHDAASGLRDGTYDFIVRGEGERAFASLCEALSTGSDWRGIPNLAWKDEAGVRMNPIMPIADLGSLPSPYRSVDGDDSLPHRIQYLEWSRGCPFSCAYCLAPLDGGVRFFPLERVKEDIVSLLEHGARTFKFLDRTFNLKPEAASELLDFIIDRHLPGTVFQFEITGDLLPAWLIQRLNETAPAGLFRFEIGVQTTNDEANLAVDRKQDTARLFENVRMLVEGGRVVIHLDLIAGLPKEDVASFINTFDATFGLLAPELQLGFLKLLHGTPLRRDASRYGYEFTSDPPYEVIQNDCLSVADLDRIRAVETCLDRFWNRGIARPAIRMIQAAAPSMFLLFERLYAAAIREGFDFMHASLIDRFRLLDAFVSSEFPDSYAMIHDELVLDYLEAAVVKPKRWWPERMRKSPMMIRAHSADPSISIDDYQKYGVVIRYRDGFAVVVYRPSGKKTVRFR